MAEWMVFKEFLKMEFAKLMIEESGKLFYD
jgi:hypothetical protein